MCSGIRIISENGEVFVCRTLEFGINVNHFPYSDDKIKGMKGYINGNTNKNDSYFIDGMNKNGLVVMAFYFPKYIEYNDIIKKDFVNLHSLELVEFLLHNCYNLDQVEKICNRVNILNMVYEPAGFVFPLHWFVCDKFGNSGVIECVKGNTIFYKNPYGIITNSPTFPEHMKIVNSKKIQCFSNKNNLSRQKIQAENLNIELKSDYCAGTGMIGLPGDYTSISRFIKLYNLQKYAKVPKNFRETLNLSFHILNSFDIIKGMVDTGNNYEYTQYTVVYNPDTMLVYFKTYENQIISRF
jgi:penicillin V acylase-like amidase (Ntn superfamily)